MGGRAAEEIIFNQQSSGASNDFEQATQIARSMVMQYGMSDKIGQVELAAPGQSYYGESGPAYSEKTAATIDEEIRRFTTEGYEQARKIIQEHREQHKIIAEALLKYETLDEKQILSLFKTGKMPEKKSDTEFPSEKAATFEEAKRELERKEAERHEQAANSVKESNAKDNEDTTVYYPNDEDHDDGSTN
jgi:cell division protease FtsH